MTETDAADFGYTLPDDHDQMQVPEDVAAMVGAHAPQTLDEISFHLGGAPSVLRVGDQFENEHHSRLTVERIQLDAVNANSVFFRGNPTPTTAGTILDHVYEGRWKRITGVLAGAAIALACLMPGHASARESLPAQDFLTPPANCTLYLAWEDHSSAAYCADGQYVTFDPDAPTGAAHGWHRNAQWLTSAR